MTDETLTDEKLKHLIEDAAARKWMDTVAALRELLARRADADDLRAALEVLERAGSEVSRLGASCGPQWSKLNFALLKARAALRDAGGTDGN